MNRLLLIAPLVALILAVFMYVGSWLIDSGVQRQKYVVYVDKNGQVFINGNPATKEMVRSAAIDYSSDFELECHDESKLCFCFIERGCIIN